MKKRLRGLIAVIMAIFAAVPMMFGCAGKPDEDYDDTKTQLFINHYLGGVGNKWIKQIKTDFETKYATYQGKDGKVGVQVIINDQKESGDALFSKIQGSSDEIYFTDKSRYIDMVTSKYVLDITDVYTEVNENDNKKIEDKLTERQKDYFKVGDGYYALPHYDSYGGISINVNIFDSKKLYFKKGGAPSEYCDFTQNNPLNAGKTVSGSWVEDGYLYTNLADTNKSAGPDGTYGTYDDGLPATYAEFFELCAYMTTKNVTPFIWSGKFGTAYMGYLLSALRADFEGIEQMGVLYDFNGGTAKNIVEIDGDNKPVFENGKLKTTSMAINADNGYYVFRSAGNYHAIDFLKRIMSSSSNYETNSTGGSSHTRAQRQFVLSEVDDGYLDEGNKIAMLIEGNYWENEARDVGIFNEANSAKPDGHPGFRYQLLPMPKVDESLIGTTNTIQCGLDNIAFINAKIPTEKIELAKDFLRFCYSDAKLQEFTKLSGVTRGLNYDLDALENDDSLSYYSKSVIQIKNNSNIAYPVSGSSVFKNNSGYFAYPMRETTSQYILQYMLNKGNENKTAKDIFAEIVKYRSAEAWANK